MNRFGEDLPDVIKLLETPATFTKEKRYPKVKSRNLLSWVEARLSALDNAFSEMMGIYEDSIKEDDDYEGDLDAFQTAMYYEGQMQAIFDILQHFGFDQADFYELTPMLQAYDTKNYRDGQSVRILREA